MITTAPDYRRSQPDKTELLPSPCTKKAEDFRDLLSRSSPAKPPHLQVPRNSCTTLQRRCGQGGVRAASGQARLAGGPSCAWSALGWPPTDHPLLPAGPGTTLAWTWAWRSPWKVRNQVPNALRQTRSQPDCISAASRQLHDSTAEADFHGSTPIILNMFKVVVALPDSAR